MKKAQIAFCLDNGYAYPTKVAVFSLLKSNPQPLRIYLLGYDLSDEHWFSFERIFSAFPNAEFCPLKLSSKILPLPEHGRHYISSASYLRLTLQNYISGKVTYLDGDILVRKSITALTDVVFEKNEYIGVIPDASAIRIHYRQVAKDTQSVQSKLNRDKLAQEKVILDELLINTCIDDPLKYFNAGIYTIDLEKLKSNKPLLNKYGSIQDAKTIGLGSDQRYLNYLFHKHAKILPFTLNSQMRNAKSIDSAVPISERANWFEARNDPAICHFLSKRKPWRSVRKSYTLSGWKRFFEYRMAMQEIRKRFGIKYKQ